MSELIYLLVGAPALYSLYNPFIKKLEDKNYKVEIIKYQDNAQNNCDYIFNYFKNKYNIENSYLIAHSFGAYYTQFLKKYYNFKKIILIGPLLITPNINGRILLFLLKNDYMRCVIIFFYYFFNLILPNKIFSYIFEINKDDINLNEIKLALDNVKINYDNFFNKNNTLYDNKYFLIAFKNDKWCNRRIYYKFPKKNIFITKSKHSFILSKKDLNIVSGKIMNILKN